MDFTIFGAAAPIWSKVAYTQPITLTTAIQLNSWSPIWVRALRFYRPNTGVYGTIRGCLFVTATGAILPGSEVSITLPNGSGPTGWMTLNLPAPLRVTNALYRIGFFFPGGTGNGYPQNKPMHARFAANDSYPEYWGGGTPGQYGWRNGPISMGQANATTMYYAGGTGLTFPNQSANTDHSLDVLVTDTNPVESSQAGPAWSLFGQTAPNAQVAIATGSAVAGLEFIPVEQMWATSIKIYRPQGQGINHSQFETGTTLMTSGTPIVAPTMHTYSPAPDGAAGGMRAYGSGDGIDLRYPAYGRLYKIDGAGVATVIPNTEITFPDDTIYAPVFGIVYSSGIHNTALEGFLSNPLRLEPNQRYRIAVGFRSGRPSSPNYFASTAAGATGLSVGPLRVLSNATATNGSAATLIAGQRTLANPTTASTANPWLDVQVTTENPSAPGEPEVPTRLWGVQAPTSSMTVGIGSRTVGLEFVATESCVAYGLRYFRYNGIGATAGRLYAVSTDGPDENTPGPSGTFVHGSEVTFPSATTDGWKFSAFRVPIRLAAGQRYRIAVRYPAGYIFTGAYFNSEGRGTTGVTSGILRIPPFGEAAGFDVTSYSIPDQFPDQPFDTHNPWIDVTVAPNPGTPTGAAGTAAEPAGALRLWGTAAPSVTVSALAAHTRVVGLEFMVERAATAHGYRFYRPATTIAGPVQARLYRVGDGQLATEVVGGDTTFTLDTTTTGWMWAPLRAPLALVGGRRYKFVLYFPKGYPSTPGWYNEDQPGNTLDRAAGILRAFSTTNATNGAQPTDMVGGTLTDAVAYPSRPATDNPWIDITVTDGDSGGAHTGEEPTNAMRAWGVDDPTGGDITQYPTPQVVGHQFTLSQSSTIHGFRMWRPDTRQQTTTARLYRVDTATSVSGTTVTFPPATHLGWSYVPLPAPVTVEAGVSHRLAVYHPVLAPSSPNRLTAPITSGVVTTASAWSRDIAELIYPQDPSPNNYWLDVAATPGGAVAEDTATLFPAIPDATVTVRTDGASSRGTTFACQREDAPDAPVWVKAVRFYRATTAITGTITGRIYEVTTSGRAIPVPDTDVVFTLSGTGWQTAELPFPVALSQLPWYRVAIHFPQGYPATANYFITGPGGQDRWGPNGVVYTPRFGYAGGDTVQGGYAAGLVLSYPTQGLATHTPHGENYWVDIVATTAEPAVEADTKPRFPLSYSQYGQITNTSNFVGETIQYAKIVDGTVAGTRSVAIEFMVDTPAYLHAYRVPRIPSGAQSRPVLARLYRVTGPSSGTPVAGSDATITMGATFWQSGHLDPAIQLVTGQRYKAVFHFQDATPIGTPYSNEVDKVRGPLRVLANARATGGTTVTHIAAQTLTYPADRGGFTGTPVVDVYLSTANPQDPLSAVRSVFDRRRPARITYQPWNHAWATTNHETGAWTNPEDPGPTGFTAGFEFYVTTTTCYLRGFRYWRGPYPVVTQATEFRLYRVTGAATGTYYPNIDSEYDTSTGVLVSGTTITAEAWTSDPNQTESYAEGWVTHLLPTPVALTQDQRYRAAVWYPYQPGGYYNPGAASRPMTDFFWSTGPGGAGLVDGPLIAPSRAQATGGTQGSMESRYDDMRYPSVGVRSNRAHYWLDVEVFDTAPRAVDGGIVTVAIPPLVLDPRRGGLGATSYVFPPLDVQATVISARNVDTGTSTALLDVTAAAIGAREIAAPPLNVLATVEGSKGASGTAEHTLATRPRQVGIRPKGVADTVDVEIVPQASARSSIPWKAMPREPDPYEFRPDAARVRFIAQNIVSRKFIHWDLPINDPTMTWNLSGPFELSGTLNPAYIDLLDIEMDEWATFIHVELQGRIVGTGILQPWAASGEELTIDAIGVASYPHGLPYLEVYEEFFPDIMMVVRECWRHIQSFPNGNLGLLLPEGYMGVPLYGDGVYDNQTGEFLGWKKWSMLWPDLIDMGSLMDGLAQSTPFDYIEAHLWNPTHTDVLHGINFYYPRAGKKRHELRFAEGENVVEAVSITEPDDAYASDMIVKGAGEGPTQIWAWVGDVLWERLRRVTVITDEQVQTVEVAQGMAIQELIRRLYLRGIETLVIEAFHPLASFGNYEVGDDILVEGMLPWVGEFGLWHRILAISLQPESGLVTLRLQRSEAFRYGREITYSK